MTYWSDWNEDMFHSSFEQVFSHSTFTSLCCLIKQGQTNTYKRVLDFFQVGI